MDPNEAENQITQLTNKMATLEENLEKLEDCITQLERKSGSSHGSNSAWRQI